MGANVALKKANRLTKLLKTTVLQVGWNGERPTLAVVTSSVLDVVHAGDPEAPTRVVITHPAAKETDVEYSDWTATSYTRRNYKGHAISVEGNPHSVNPYGSGRRRLHRI